MLISLSPASRTLIVQLFFFALALGALYGVYDNRLFFLRFPFYALAGIDLLFAGTFIYLAYQFAQPSQTSVRLAYRVTIAYWVYTVLVGLGSSALHAWHLGIGNVAQAVNMSVPLYVTTELLYFGVLPSSAFGFILFLLKKIRARA